MMMVVVVVMKGSALEFNRSSSPFFARPGQASTAVSRLCCASNASLYVCMYVCTHVRHPYADAMLFK